MYVCLCNAVTEKHITEAVVQGARKMKDLRAKLRVGSTCGRCSSCARKCLQQGIESASECISAKRVAIDCALEAVCS